MAAGSLTADPRGRACVRSSGGPDGAAGYFVVLDAVLGPWLLPIMEPEFAAAGVGYTYVVLRPARDVALARGTSRAGQEVSWGLPALADPGPISQLWDLFSDLGELEANVIDTTDLDVAATEAAIWQRYER